MESTERVAAVKAVSAWIKSSDRLPDSDITCWVFYKRLLRVEVCVFSVHHQCWDDEDGDDFRFRLDEVSHWQPYIVPSPPSE